MIKCSEVYTEDLIFDTQSNATIIRGIASVLDGGSYDINDELSTILTTNKDTTEIEYLLNRQDKYISPLFERIYNHNPSEENHLTMVTNTLAHIIINKFLKGWSKLADAVFADYNPTENYNMIENRNTDFNEHTVTENSETVTNRYSGFNSGDSLSTVSQSDTNGDIDTSKTDSGSSATNELTRRGNIGVTTTQQMIESSFNLAKKNLLNVIYHDIDTILFIDYYC